MSEKGKSAKGIQVQGKPKASSKTKPCPWTGSMVPTNVPGPGETQSVLHPRKDVFVLKVAKVGPNGDRRCKMELELATPKGTEKKIPSRVDTRETQCEPDPPPCCCLKPKKKKEK
ncbi:hypothetical protein K1T71_000236 [Dendrolimus kikuchii]|uniref:Uncharacterized protein n=1 Tax=Dendrolimus kikuchii TaxID=765133 RepID=A0ACC1DIK3_9NEOP|nr:hypothetical protein K1T71_000236 [Dendrolimus kikuchii]